MNTITFLTLSPGGPVTLVSPQGLVVAEYRCLCEDCVPPVASYRSGGCTCDDDDFFEECTKDWNGKAVVFAQGFSFVLDIDYDSAVKKIQLLALGA